MSALKIPAPDAHASEWGALALSIPGWRWMPGMAVGGEVSPRHRRVGDHWHMRSAMLDPRRQEAWPDPDDPATAGCLLSLLGPGEWDNVAPGCAIAPRGEGWWAWMNGDWSEGMTLGRACIAAAATKGRWPGGAS